MTAIKDLNARVVVRGCAPQLRQVRRNGELILQQMWRIKTLENRVVINEVSEWQDVPIVEDK